MATLAVPQTARTAWNLDPTHTGPNSRSNTWWSPMWRGTSKQLRECWLWTKPWNVALEAGSALIGDEVTITLDVQLVKAW